MAMYRHGNPTEVLSPCGEEESLDTALRYGADAVYLAGKEFGMRTASKNFDYEQIKSSVVKAHEAGARLYVTCNTVPTNDEIKRLPQHFEILDDIGVDAVIVADVGVMELAKKYAEELGVKLGDFMMPIRMAVTGSRVSPPLIGSILILGVEKSLARIERTLAEF